MDKVYEVIYRQKGGLYNKQRFFGTPEGAAKFAEGCVSADIIEHEVY